MSKLRVTILSQFNNTLISKNNKWPQIKPITITSTPVIYQKRNPTLTL